MTNEQKLNELLKELGALLADKNTTIECQRYQIDLLEKRVRKAEDERDAAIAHAAQAAAKNAEMRDEIEKLKGDAA